jgi:hypothetical protein
MRQVEVEVLSSPSCPSRDATLDAVRRTAEQAGVAAVLIERVVASDEEARALRMPGSPTVRVAGRDVQPGAEAREDFGLG